MKVKLFWHIALGVRLPYVDMSCSKISFGSIVEFQANGSWGSSGGRLVCINNVSVKDVKAGMAHIEMDW